ncbi:hypothetical protein UPYG_G00207100 [Umbra pygmaea]|uniref:Uncharacterized protein n=1 Tax=Umbra pygmaea TaxID=75934 RepID=A0ABD0WP20_UMBPY
MIILMGKYHIHCISLLLPRTTSEAHNKVRLTLSVQLLLQYLRAAVTPHVQRKNQHCLEALQITSGWLQARQTVTSREGNPDVRRAPSKVSPVSNKMSLSSVRKWSGTFTPGRWDPQLQRWIRRFRDLLKRNWPIKDMEHPLHDADQLFY